MIVIDTNVLVYAHHGDVSFHEQARSMLTSVIEGSSTWAIPWPCVHEFVGVVTNRRLWKQTFTLAEAFICVDQWTSSPHCQLIGEGPDHLVRLREVAMKGEVSGARIHDAQIAAICLSHGVRELWSCDRDFSRFPTLRTRNPLIR